MIIKKLVVGPIAANCYIVGSEITKEAMIIDPGADADEILKNVDELGLEIKLIVLTHRHWDHSAAVNQIKRATGVKLATHAEAEPFLSKESRDPMGITHEASPPDILLKGGDSIDIGDLHFTVLYTPGHSVDGISLVGQGVAFTGDTLFNSGIGRYDLSDSNYRQLMDGIYTKLMVLPDDTRVYPGHGPDTTISTERRLNPFLNS